MPQADSAEPWCRSNLSASRWGGTAAWCVSRRSRGKAAARWRGEAARWRWRAVNSRGWFYPLPKARSWVGVGGIG